MREDSEGRNINEPIPFHVFLYGQGQKFLVDHRKLIIKCWDLRKKLE